MRTELLVLSLLVVQACASGDNTALAAGNTELPQWQISDEPTLSIGVAEGDSVYQFYQVRSAIRLSDTIIVVANTGTLELRYYDQAGTFLYKTGGRGEGPGEFRFLKKLYPMGTDTVMAYDGFLRKSYFDASVEFVGSEEMRVEGARTFPFGTWMYRRNLVEGIAPSDRERMAQLLDRLPAPSPDPGYWLVRMFADGQIWVSDDLGPTGERNVWTVVDSTGPVARLTLPSRFEAFEATEHDVLGRWRDENDVEYIRIYAVHKPEGLAQETARSFPDQDPPDFTGDSTLILDNVQNLLRQAITLQEMYFADNTRYTSNRHDLRWELPEGLHFDFVSAVGTGWFGVMTHDDAPVICGVGIGTESPPGWLEAQPVCGDLNIQ